MLQTHFSVVETHHAFKDILVFSEQKVRGEYEWKLNYFGEPIEVLQELRQSSPQSVSLTQPTISSIPSPFLYAFYS